MSVAILVPYHRSEPPEVEWHQALGRMWKPEKTLVLWCTEVPSIAEAREYLAKQALQTNAEWLFWVDSDNLVPPDALKLMLTYAQRFGPAAYCGAYYTKKNRFEVTLAAWVKAVDPRTGQPAYRGLHPDILNSKGELVEVDVAGMGCCLEHRSIYEKIPPPWFKWTFDPFLGAGTSEDFFHFERVKAHGFKVYLCTRVLCAHIGRFKMVFYRDPKTGKIVPEPVYTMIRDRRPEYVPQV